MAAFTLQAAGCPCCSLLLGVCCCPPLLGACRGPLLLGCLLLSGVAGCLLLSGVAGCLLLSGVAGCLLLSAVAGCLLLSAVAGCLLLSVTGYENIVAIRHTYLVPPTPYQVHVVFLLIIAKLTNIFVCFGIICFAVLFSGQHQSRLPDVAPLGCSGCWTVTWRCLFTCFWGWLSPVVMKGYDWK